MTYEKFASDLPRDRTFSFTSVEETEEELLRSGVYQPMRQTGKGKFRSHLAVLSTEQDDLFSDRYNTAISHYLEPSAREPGDRTKTFDARAEWQTFACLRSFRIAEIPVAPYTKY